MGKKELTVEEIKQQLINWLNISKFKQDWEKQIVVCGGIVFVHLYTSEYKYRISASVTGYLGCTATCRKYLPGEDWFRGTDLADGEFNTNTWMNILSDIVGHGIIKLTPKDSPLH